MMGRLLKENVSGDFNSGKKILGDFNGGYL